MYLSKIYIKNFRGIKELLVKFDKKLNVIIGANGQLKTSLMDAIRLFYTWGEPNRDIEITKEDFHVEITENPDGTKTLINSTRIDICYLFEELSAQQEGAFYQYLVSKNDDTIVARIHISFEMKENGRIYSSYITGKEENGLRADWNTFHYFHPYYLGALRDSTRDLMSSRNNLLGRVIKRKIDRAGSENDVKGIVDSANEQLLLRPEVIETQTGINDNLNQINSSSLQNVELHIEQSRIEYIVNIIKPFLPYSATDKKGFGDNLFRDWRYNKDGTLKKDFVLNDPRYGGVILVAGKNFGSGSSREHAAWAIAGYGFRVVISSFFADIHKNNELNNFVLPVVVSEPFLTELFSSIENDPKTEVEVNLPKQTVTNKASGNSEHFEINGYKKHCLMNGLDDIDYLLQNKDKIEAWEQSNK